jgi:ribosomal protein S12 methylthiotransferase
LNTNEDWHDLSRLPQEPRRLRGACWGSPRNRGISSTRDAADADVLIVNTCAFIDKAKQESIDTILEMAEHKKTGACQRLVVTGCLAERYRDELREQIPEIDAVLGTGEVPEIVNGDRAPDSGFGIRTIRFTLRSNGEQVGTSDQEPGPSDEFTRPTTLRRQHARSAGTPRHYAYVKIAEGCDYKCAFCIIPTLRGSYRSRTHDSIVTEAARLAEQGVKELLLISQDTTFYGIDRGERGALARLLRALDQVEGIEWIRLLYLYPTTITDDVLDAMAESRKVCRYVDLPLQHAADRVLKRMKRPGTRAGYERLLERIRVRVPGVTLRTTFIVGFPGETPEDYAELESFVEPSASTTGCLHLLARRGTSAHDLADNVPAAVKKRRRPASMRLQRRIVTGPAVADWEPGPNLVMGRRQSNDLVLAGGWRDRPEIDPRCTLDRVRPVRASRRDSSSRPKWSEIVRMIWSCVPLR